MTKNGKKSNVLIESIPRSLCLSLLFVYFCCGVIHMDLFFQDKVKCSSFIVKLKHQYHNAINKIIFAQKNVHKVATQLPDSYY